MNNDSCGTDAGNPDESKWDDWRGIGVLFTRAEHFSIGNLHIVESHGRDIFLEDCSYSRVEKIDFDMLMHKEIDGMIINMDNQDGIDIRNGCHYITIFNSGSAITFAGYMKDHVITNVVNRKPNTPMLHVSRPDGMTNMVTSGLVQADK